MSHFPHISAATSASFSAPKLVDEVGPNQIGIVSCRITMKTMDERWTQLRASNWQGNWRRLFVLRPIFASFYVSSIRFSFRSILNYAACTLPRLRLGINPSNLVKLCLNTPMLWVWIAHPISPTDPERWSLHLFRAQASAVYDNE